MDAVTEPNAPSLPEESAEWREMLLDGHRATRMMRTMFRLLPSPPRCKVCSNPFGGFGGKVCKLAGFTPSRKNPDLCSRCCEKLPQGGATVDVGVLFADIRGSTTLGERMAPAQFAGEMNQFYRQTTSVLLKHGAVIDKLSGDGVMALFLKGISGPDYRINATAAARDLQGALVGGNADRPAIPVGIGLHIGEAFVGNVGSGVVVDFTALGDTVNIAARLQSLAAPGEIVMSETAFAEMGEGHPEAEARVVALRGKQDDFPIRVLRRPGAVTT